MTEKTDLERARDVAVQLENENARLENEQEALLKVTADLISDVGYARHTLARDVLGWAEAREDMDLRQTVFYAAAEHRSELARVERLENEVEQHVTANLEAANRAQQVIDQLREDLESCRRHNLAAGDKGIRAEARAEGAEQQLAEAQDRITTLEHVARGNKRHVQMIVPQLEAAAALHRWDDSNPRGPWCATCMTAWPCRTAAALDAPAGPAPDDPADCCDNCHTAPCETWCHEDGSGR